MREYADFLLFTSSLFPKIESCRFFFFYFNLYKTRKKGKDINIKEEVLI